jgi:hypothetical protein
MGISSMLIVFGLLYVASFLIEDSKGCSNTCRDFNPNKCLNTITGSVGSSSTFGTFSTSGVNSVKQLDCGSRDSNLNDLVSQFAVSVRGVYEISTINLSSGGDTTLQINECNGKTVACNDDVSSSVSVFWEIEYSAELR